MSRMAPMIIWDRTIECFDYSFPDPFFTFSNDCIFSFLQYGIKIRKDFTSNVMQYLLYNINFLSNCRLTEVFS